MDFILNELNKLVVDYNRCHDSLIQECILQDINLLCEALTLMNTKDENETLYLNYTHLEAVMSLSIWNRVNVVEIR